MGTFWHKPGYTRSDRDADGEILPGALRPGIYCEDEAALAQLRRGAHEHSRMMIATQFGWSLEGQAVYLCTPAQAQFFRATATDDPAAHAAALEEAAIAAEATRVALLNAAKALNETVYGSDGKVDVMANRRERSKGVRVPDYETAVEEQITITEQAARAMARQAMRGMTGEEFGRRFMRHAPAGANRKARRAAAAQARRGA